MELKHINTEMGIAGYVDGKPFFVTALHIVEGRIRGIYSVVNPEKLAR